MNFEEMTKEQLEAEKQRLDEQIVDIQAQRKLLRKALEPHYLKAQEVTGGATTVLSVGGK